MSKRDKIDIILLRIIFISIFFIFMKKPVILVIIDGWGINNNSQGNVLKETQLPTIKKMIKFYPMVALQASGISVGLPWGEPGNSEVGHITLGAGKIIYQNLPRISLSIQDGTFFRNEAFLSAMTKVNKNNSALHLMGLVGEGSVHSYTEHLFSLLEMAKNQKVKKIFIHIFTDGRDSPPTSGVKSITNLMDKIKMIGIGRIASISGRSFGMDRNNNWDRVEKSYNVIVKGEGEKITDILKYLEDSYAQELTDEYIQPAVMTEDGKPIGLVNNNDSVIFFNFREDRAREITKAFVLPGFEKFKRDRYLNINFVTMTEYEKDLPVNIAYAKEEIKNGLGEILSNLDLKQLRMAETEKYAHVTYFFNGGREEPWSGEDRILIPSPSVATFDLAPEMSAFQLTEKIIQAVKSGKYSFILINYANADMVGHTGKKEACAEAVRAIDKSLSLIIPAVLSAGGSLFVTSDHGNVEEIKNFYTGQTDTEHSTNPVPFWYIAPKNHREKKAETIVRQETEIGGLLSDVAPTILEIMDIKKPEEMTGQSLLPMLK